jgi:membrane protease YdiL (CAAX protease family)
MVSTAVTMVLGLVFAIPFTGFDIILNFDQLNDLSDPKSINLLKYFQIVNQIGTFILPVILFAWLETRTIGSSLLLNTRVDIKILLLSIILVFTSIPFINTLVSWNEQMVLPEFLWRIENWMKDSEEQVKLLTEAFLNTSTLGGLIVNLIMIALLAAIGEEFLFRGVLLKLLFQGTKNIHAAVWISAFIFSAFHLQFYGFVPRMALGLIFGYVFIWSGSLWIPIILHFVFNGVSVVAAYLYQLEIIDVDVDTLGSTQNSLIILVSLVISLGLLYLIFMSKREIDRSKYSV